MTTAFAIVGPGTDMEPPLSRPRSRLQWADIDRDTLRRAVAGDAESCRQIVEAFERPLFSVIYRMVGGRYPNDIEDIAQDVFLRIFRALDRFDPSRGIKFSTWVFTFVKNYCIDLLKRKHRPVFSFDDSEEGRPFDPAGGDLGPPLRAMGGELGERIGAAVATLPEDQRLVFILREYQGLDYRTIGRLTGYAPGTVRSRLYRAKDSLRHKLRHFAARDYALPA
ncbi:MAG: sigma-70 family RNA polymerase sigma factor [Planctomycetota bacterium]